MSASNSQVTITDGTNLLSVTPAGALPVDGSAVIQPVSGTVAATQSGAWTTGRTWALASGGDSVAAVQSGVWSTGRTWALASGTDSVASVQSGVWSTGRTWTLSNVTDSIAAVQSGTWTVQQGTPPWSVSQSGTWTTGRTWALASGTDSVAAVQSGSWTVAGTGNFTVVQPTGTNLHTVVDSGSITVNNAAGASAVNIQDGGNTITVDGTVTANQGTPAATANRWPVQITDGTDLMIVDPDGSIYVKPVPVGTQGNAWNAATVSSGNNSATIDCQYARTISIFGNSSNNLNPMRVQASQDNTNFFTLTTFAITAGNFGVTIDFGARYLRLQSGQGTNFTVTATVAGK